ncbi:MAG TPA: hypothetical protein VHR42_04415 [Clostridia bacterium]|nr:hypothetical protein [Clostridia bacterium]
MKTTKLVSSIVSIVLAAAGICYELISHAKNFSGISCWLVAIAMIVAGIIGIVMLSSKNWTVVATVIYAAAGIFGIIKSFKYSGLLIGSIVSLVIAVIFLISIFKQDYSVAEKVHAPVSAPAPKQ